MITQGASMIRALYEELPKEVTAFLLIAAAAFVTGLGLRFRRSTSVKADEASSLAGAALMVLSGILLVAITVWATTDAIVRVGFKRKLATVTSSPFVISVDDRIIADDEAEAIVRALFDTYGRPASHSSPTNQAKLEIRSDAGFVSLSVRQDSRHASDMWVSHHERGRLEQPIGRVRSQELATILFPEQ